MPTPTYNLIEEQVLPSAIASVTLGNGGTIPQTYRDLIIEFVGSQTASGGTLFVQYNGDTGSNYSMVMLAGNGTSPTTSKPSNQSQAAFLGYQVGNTTGQTTGRLEIMSYANTNVNTTALARSNDAAAYTEAGVSTWRSTAAVTSITVKSNTTTITAGSIIRLWGV